MNGTEAMKETKTVYRLEMTGNKTLKIPLQLKSSRAIPMALSPLNKCIAKSWKGVLQ